MRRLVWLFAFVTLPLFAVDKPIATILVYHEVDPGGVPPHGTRVRSGVDPANRDEQVRFTVSTENFKEQLDYLQSNEFTVIPLTDLIDFLEGHRDSLPPKPVVITVDDGWLCTYTQMFPELQKRKLPFTAFIYPQILTAKAKHYLSWAQVEEMARAGVDIESHSYTHADLTKTADLEHELLDSKNEIEKHTRQPIRAISFPYGAYNATVIEAAQKYGYEAAVYDRDANAFVMRTTPLMHLRRFPVRHDTTMETFRTYFAY